MNPSGLLPLMKKQVSGQEDIRLILLHAELFENIYIFGMYISGGGFNVDIYSATRSNNKSVFCSVGLIQKRLKSSVSAVELWSLFCI